MMIQTNIYSARKPRLHLSPGKIAALPKQTRIDAIKRLPFKIILEAIRQKTGIGGVKKKKCGAFECVKYTAWNGLDTAGKTIIALITFRVLLNVMERIKISRLKMFGLIDHDMHISHETESLVSINYKFEDLEYSDSGRSCGYSSSDISDGSDLDVSDIDDTDVELL